jgi:deferrochelatase/peroxidase EfeB
VRLDRRRFFTRSALALGAVATGEAVAASRAQAPGDPPPADRLRERIAFDGPHQAGVLEEPRDAVVLAALDAIAPDTQRLGRGLAMLSARARELTQGWRMPPREADDPPLDSGALGTDVAPDGLTVTLGFGHSLFGERYGLTAPAGLTRMTPFDGDRLSDDLAHGDALLMISAHNMDTASHALRELLRQVRNELALRWWIDGFQGAARGPSPRSARRNLFGFRDGTANPDTRDDALMRRLVWDADGGTYLALRLIRMHLEFWDRVGLREQEMMIGRRRDTGAPLGGDDEFQDPRLAEDPKGERIPLDAHIRLARGKPDEAMLRRAWNYQRGFDRAGQLDQGLIFAAFNQDPERQFVAAQKRLAGEPLTDYITPVGGGYYYVPRGARGPGDWVGSPLFASA